MLFQNVAQASGQIFLNFVIDIYYNKRIFIKIDIMMDGWIDAMDG